MSKKLAPSIEIPGFRIDAAAQSSSVVMDPTRFVDLFKEKNADEEIVRLIDSNKRFIAGIPDHERYLGRLASEGWRAAMAKLPEGWTSDRTLDGVLALAAYAPTGQGWKGL